MIILGKSCKDFSTSRCKSLLASSIRSCKPCKGNTPDNKWYGYPSFDAKTSSLTVTESSHPSWRTGSLPVRTKPTSCPILERRRPLQRCEYSSPSGSRSTTGRLQRSRWRSASEAEGWPASAEVSLLPCVVWDHLQRAVQQGQSAAQGAFNVQRPHERQGICNAEYCLVYQKGDGARTILLIWCLRARY